MIGHTISAAGAIGLIVSLLTIRDNVIHPTINYTSPDSRCDLNYVPNTAIQRQVDTAMCNCFGFGGSNATLVVKRFQE
jgi:3-oxoacyl-[acyl-carrier-protein] synthase II